MPKKTTAEATNSAAAQQEYMMHDGIDNYELPKAVVTRIAKSAIPENAKLQKDTIMSFVKGSTMFINYLAATAQDVATQRSHKTISAADILKALEIIEFGDMVPYLETDLKAYRDIQKKVAKPAAAAKEDPKGKGKEKDTASTSGPTVPATPTHASTAPPEASTPTRGSGSTPRMSARTKAKQEKEQAEKEKEEKEKAAQGAEKTGKKGKGKAADKDKEKGDKGDKGDKEKGDKADKEAKLAAKREIDIPEDEVAKFDEEEEDPADEEDEYDYDDEEEGEETLAVDEMQVDEDQELAAGGGVDAEDAKMRAD